MRPVYAQRDEHSLAMAQDDEMEISLNMFVNGIQVVLLLSIHANVVYAGSCVIHPGGIPSLITIICNLDFRKLPIFWMRGLRN